jgi:hypothetical protein
MPERTCQRAGCGRQIPPRKRKDARWCSRSCESKARRAAARMARFEAANGSAELLGVESQSLGELYDRSGRPDHWDDPETEFSDAFDLLHEAQDDSQDETGIVAGNTAPDPWEQRNAAFRERMQLTEVAEEIRTRYEHLLEPFRQSSKRNPGVRPVAMARLEQERDEEIRELHIRQQRAEALEHAVRMAPQRAAQAAERRLEQAALNAFGRDLMGGSRRYQAPQWSGRPTDDIAVW